MKVYFASYSHSKNGLSGSDVYNHNLAKVMMGWGWEVRSLSLHTPGPFDCEGVQVGTLDDHITNQRWCDFVITHPGPHILTKLVKKICIIKHNVDFEPRNFNQCKVIYCGKHVSEVAAMPCHSSFVWNPGNRFFQTTDRGNPDGPWIMVNCNENKGGRRLIELAEAMPHKRFAGILGAYGQQIRKALPNLEYWQGAGEIGQYFQKAAGLLCLSTKEGFPTGVMEAMSHGLPIVANKNCAGLMDALGFEKGRVKAGLFGESVNDWAEIIETLGRSKPYVATSNESLARAKEIEESRDFEGLKRFFQS